jgi:hypothetical protein
LKTDLPLTALPGNVDHTWSKNGKNNLLLHNISRINEFSDNLDEDTLLEKINGLEQEIEPS